MKLARPGYVTKGRDSVLASTPSFKRRLEAARPVSLSLVLGGRGKTTMKYYIPIGKPSDRPDASDAAKFGGNPFGLPDESWPKCSGCKKPMTFLAQFDHCAEVDLGRPERRLYLFQCEYGCESWEAEAGANAALIMEGAATTDRPTIVPPGIHESYDEIRIVDFEPDDDGTGPEHRDYFYSSKHPQADWWDVFSQVPQRTKIGGYPTCVQDPAEMPEEPFRFLMQLTSQVSVLSEREATYLHTDGRHYLDWGANFGTGLAYIHVDVSSIPRARIFWQ